MTTLLFAFVFVPCLFLNCTVCLAPFLGHLNAKQFHRIYRSYSLLCLAMILIFYCAARMEQASFALIKYSVLSWAVLIPMILTLVYPRYWQEYIFCSTLVTMLNYLLGAFAAYLTNHFYGWDSIETYIGVELLSSLFMGICYYPIRQLILRTLRPFLSSERNTFWRSIFLLPAAMLLSAYFMLPSNEHIVSFSQVLSRFFMIVTTFFICNSMSKEYALYKEKQEMTEQLRQQKLYYVQIGQELEQARRQRHDFKHHLVTIQHYIETQNITGLQEYMGSMSAQNEMCTPIPYSGNSPADGVIYHFVQQSHADHIQFSYQGTIRSDGIADTDLCVLLGNALDNALTGCMTIPENRFIYLTVQSKKQLLSILIQNSFDGIVEESKGGRMLSRKRQNCEGIGIRSMESICKRYGGTLEYSWDANTFTLCILLPLHQLTD